MSAPERSSRMWLSICSAHQEHDSSCPRCSVGKWVSRSEYERDLAEFAADPDAWRLAHSAPPDLPAYGALARAEALIAGRPDWMNVTRWPLQNDPEPPR